MPRLTLPGYPHHIVQRGNNRQAIFAETADYHHLLDLLQEYAKKFDVDVHAYVLMRNHFHLLATPKTVDGLPQMMQAVGRRYVRYFNTAQRRTGTLWEGRYKSTLLQPERYLLACMAYMDLNPVRAGLVVNPEDYPWSSYGHYAGQRTDKIITPHAMVWALGNTPFAREAAYAEWVHSGPTAVQQTALTDAVLGGWALGDADFVTELQKKTTRRVSKRTPGRPLASKET